MSGIPDKLISRELNYEPITVRTSASRGKQRLGHTGPIENLLRIGFEVGLEVKLPRDEMNSCLEFQGTKRLILEGVCNGKSLAQIKSEIGKGRGHIQKQVSQIKQLLLVKTHIGAALAFGSTEILEGRFERPNTHVEVIDLSKG